MNKLLIPVYEVEKTDKESAQQQSIRGMKAKKSKQVRNKSFDSFFVSTFGIPG